MTVSLAQHATAELVPDWLVEAPVRVVRDQMLFRRGEPKTHIYLIEAGTIAVCETHIGGTNSVLEFAFAGDTVGFGFLEHHIYSAQAVGEARVKCLPLTALDRILQHDKRAMQRYAAAMQREFEFRRDQLLSLGRKPANRLAAFFLAVSRRNQEEGRDPLIVADSLECGTVADYLELDLDTLGRALVELEHADLVEKYPHGLRLTDLAGLALLADEVTQT